MTFTLPTKWCTSPLAVDESLTQESIREIIESLDEDLLDAAGIIREGFVVHVFQGRETGVYTDDDGYGEKRQRDLSRRPFRETKRYCPDLPQRPAFSLSCGSMPVPRALRTPSGVRPALTINSLGLPRLGVSLQRHHFQRRRVILPQHLPHDAPQPAVDVVLLLAVTIAPVSLAAASMVASSAGPQRVHVDHPGPHARLRQQFGGVQAHRHHYARLR